MFYLNSSNSKPRLRQYPTVGSKPIMKQKLDKGELIQQLRNQLDKIKDFTAIYDSGKPAYAQDIAVKMRILFHNTNNSKSLLRQ